MIRVISPVTSAAASAAGRAFSGGASPPSTPACRIKTRLPRTRPPAATRRSLVRWSRTRTSTGRGARVSTGPRGPTCASRCASTGSCPGCSTPTSATPPTRRGSPPSPRPAPTTSPARPTACARPCHRGSPALPGPPSSTPSCRACRVLAERAGGREIGFVDEVERCFGVRIARGEPDRYREAHRDLDAPARRVRRPPRAPGRLPRRRPPRPRAPADRPRGRRGPGAARAHRGHRGAARRART